MNNKPHKPELLLPAGNTEAFYAAIEAGADAIYLGAKQFNAREKASNFSPSQLNTLVKLAHQNNVLVYITLNTIIKNNDLQALLDIILQIKNIKPDALIIQDIGVYHILNKFFPEIELHASTQMANHNSLGTAFAKQLGIKRVIMARELSLDEILSVAKTDGSDIEIFVHGALCYSFSGMCLFSSYLGGMSANRGQCKQPCRRFYNGKEKGFLFSLKDNQLIDYIPEFSRIGVKSLKIEGRFKSPEYVYTVGTAYRMAIDDHSKISEAKKILEFDFGREKTQYFVGGNISESITKAPASGLFMGNIINYSEQFFEIKSDIKLEKNVRLRVLSQNHNEKAVFKIKEFSKTDNTYKINHNIKNIEKGDIVYLTSFPGKKFASKFDEIIPLHQKTDYQIKNKIISQLQKPETSKNNKIKLHIRIDNLAWLPKVDLRTTDLLIIKLSISELKSFKPETGLIQKFKNKIAIELPEFIMEKQIEQYKELFQKFFKHGINNYVINHISQICLLNKKSNIISSEYIYCLNDAAIIALKNLNIKNYIRPLESDYENLTTGKDRKGIIPVYYRPKLFISRMPVKTGDSFKEIDNSKYHNIKRDGQTYIIPEIPVSLTQYVNKLKNEGFYNFLIDFSFIKPSSNVSKTIIKRFSASQQIQPSNNFNFKMGLT